jgi:hypothetical protein
MKIEHMAMKSHLWTKNPQAIGKISVHPKPYWHAIYEWS